MVIDKKKCLVSCWSKGEPYDEDLFHVLLGKRIIKTVANFRIVGIKYYSIENG